MYDQTDICNILNVAVIPLDMGRAIGWFVSSTSVHEMVLLAPSYQATSLPLRPYMIVHWDILGLFTGIIAVGTITATQVVGEPVGSLYPAALEHRMRSVCGKSLPIYPSACVDTVSNSSMNFFSLDERTGMLYVQRRPVLSVFCPRTRENTSSTTLDAVTCSLSIILIFICSVYSVTWDLHYSTQV